MRLAIFSDVHSNLEALCAVIEAYQQEAIDNYFCLGDVVGYGADPNLCCQLVREMVEFSILGNHDAAVTKKMDYSCYSRETRQVLDWTAQSLDTENMQWLSSLKYQNNREEILFSHGAPLAPKQFEYVYTPLHVNLLQQQFDQLPKIIFVGHSHLCKAFAYDPIRVTEIFQPEFQLKDSKYIISVGSVGQPRDYDNRASYTILDTSDNSFYFKRIQYPIEVSAQKIKDAGIANEFAQRLFMGR